MPPAVRAATDPDPDWDPDWDPSELEIHRGFMEEALREAHRAAEADEVPIGCVVVLEGRVLARGRNRTRELKDPTAHAEVLALSEAARSVAAPRLPGAVVYTTVEPCFMCAGACLHARVARVVFGVPDPKFGGCVSLGNVLGDPRLNHRAELVAGVLAERSRRLLQDFFRAKRSLGR